MTEHPRTLEAEGVETTPSMAARQETSVASEETAQEGFVMPYQRSSREHIGLLAVEHDLSGACERGYTV